MKKLLLIIPLFICVACEEEKDSTVIFSATFNGEFRSERNAYIFISDNDGNILAEKTFQGDASFDLITDLPSEEIPDRINVTTIGHPDSNYYQPEITTNIGVLTGSNWTWVDPYVEYDLESIGTSNYTFANIPDGLENVYFSTKGSSNKERNINYEGWYTLNLNENNVNVLAMALFYDGTALYKIIENVSDGETHELDFSEFQETEQKIINNLTGEECNYINVQGFLEEDDHYWGEGFQLVRGNTDGSNWNEDGDFIINYPPNLFSKFKVGITVGQYNVPGEKDWYRRTFGNITESVEKINADINNASLQGVNFEVDISGTYDQWGLSLQDDLSGHWWTLYISPDIASGSLPNFPQTVYDEYPDLNRNSFSIYRVTLADFLCADNMDEWLEMFFNYDGYYGDICSEVRWLNYPQ